MLCPQCQNQAFSIAVVCPNCGFTGDTTLLEQLSNLNFVLTESKSWGLVRSMLEPIQMRYQKQQREVEITLGLRQPPPDTAEVRQLRLELAKFTALHNAISQWIAKGWLPSKDGFALRIETQAQIDRLRTRLEDAVELDEPVSLTKRLMIRWEQLGFVRENIEKLYEAGQINANNYQLALDQLEAQIADVEIKAGLRQRPKAEPQSTPKLVSEPDIEPAIPLRHSTLSVTTDDIPVQPSRPPRQPWTWDRFMDSLLSERTLKAILFLGAMLLFAAAVSWVASNWGEFSPFIQGTFLVSVTAVFFGLGWFVRVKRGLHESGVAISAVASFLVPLDFLVYYLSGGFPAQSWPTVWLAGSIVCLGVYLVMTVALQAEFFGYLVAIAAGSLTISLLNWLNVPLDWWQIGATGTALTLAIGSEWCRTAKDDWRVFAAPFGRMALVTAVPVMLVAVGWGYLVGNRPTAFYLALAISWWLGGATITTMARQYHWRSLVVAATLIFPIAVWLSLDWATISRATFALGWAALTPIYFAIAYRLWQQADDAEFQAYSRSILRVGWLLVILSTLWPLTNPQVARWVHLWLAVTMALATWLWQRPRTLWLTSLFLMMAATMWQGSQGAAPPEITLSWSLLAILHVATAVWVDGKQLSVHSKRYTAVLFGAGAVLAAFALLPALLFNDLALMAYAVGNFIGVNGWLAYVAHGRQHAGLQTLLAQPRLQRLPVPSISLFQWLAALAIIPWLSLLWINNDWSQAYLPLAYGILGWGLLWLGLRLRRLHWFYGAPWHVVAHISILGSLGFGFVFYEQWVMTAVLLSAAAFHFASAWLMPRMRWLGMFVGGLLLPVGWLVGLELIGVKEQGLLPFLAVIPLAYLIAGMTLTYGNPIKQTFMEPLYTAAMLVAGVVVVWGMMNLARFWYDDVAFIWVALAYVQLGLSFLLYAWQYDLEGWGHLGVWAGVIAGGLVIKSLSRGSGLSAVFAALLALALVAAERGLHRLAVRQHKRLGAICRRGWRLYKRPLLTAAWVVSVGTIGMALGRNLLWLGGGITRQTYAIIALSLITGLYALSAHFYKKERFLWFATVLVIAPWTLLANLRWYWGGRLSFEWYGLNWVILGLLMLGVAVLIRGLEIKEWRLLLTHLQSPITNLQRPPLIIAHLLVPLGLIWGLAFADASSVAFGLAVLFYVTAVWIDHHFRDKDTPADNRFLFPAAILLPVWAVYLLFWADPNPAMTTTGLLVLAFTLPMLALGRWVRHWQPAYQWPLYLVAYGSAVCATVLVLGERPTLIGVLLFNTALAVLSTYLFRKREWLVPAVLLLPWAAWLILEQINLWQPAYYGWTLMGLGALYLIWTYVLRQADLTEYGQPLLAAMFVTVAVGILFASDSQQGILIGYTAAAVLWGITAVWLRDPLVMATVPPLLAFAYWNGIDLLNIPATSMWLTAWPGIIALLAVGWLLDEEWGIEPKVGQSKQLDTFPWYKFWLWPTAVWQRLRRWWGLSFHVTALVGTILFTLYLVAREVFYWNAVHIETWQLAIVLGLGTAVFTYTLFRFRQRGLLLLAWMWLQFTYITTLSWLFPSPSRAAEVALAFMPMTIGTAAMGLVVQKLRLEAAPFGGGFRQWWFGWSRPFYAILAVNLFISQAMAFDGDVGIIVTLLNTTIIGVLATVWLTDWLVYVPLALGWVASIQYLDWLNLPRLAQPTVFAVLTVLYGIIGYALLYWQRTEADALRSTPSALHLWQRPLRHAAWFLSAITLLRALSLGGSVLLSLPFAIFDLPVITARTLGQANMLVLVFAILGLFYLAAAFVARRRWLGYGSVGMLLGAWSLWLIYVQHQTELQLYALPASIYLLAVGWLEWEQGSRHLASWIDRAAVLLMFGAAFWQSFMEDWGILYALLMMFEGLALLWLGSVRRLRRLLYAGVGGVITAVIGQLIEPLFNLDTYIFLILGAFLLAMGILIEQRREKVLQFAHELRLKLEDWE